MRVMVLVKASEATEAGRMPSEEDLRAMGAYNEQLVAAGIMRGGEGLHASARGRRVRFDAGGTHTVTAGPFGPAQDVLAGFWLWEVASMDEATEWLKRAPFPAGAELELRPLIGMDDLGEAVTPEIRDRDQRLRETTARQGG